jgi:hypothetical protein
LAKGKKCSVFVLIFSGQTEALPPRGPWWMALSATVLQLFQKAL